MTATLLAEAQNWSAALPGCRAVPEIGSALSVQLPTKSSELTYASQQLGFSSGKAESTSWGHRRTKGADTDMQNLTPPRTSRLYTLGVVTGQKDECQ